MSGDWQILPALYDRARDGCVEAAWCLRQLAVERLSWLLARTFALPERCVLVQLSAEEGFVLAISHCSEIPTWPQAWTFAKKISWRVCRRNIRRRKEISSDAQPTDPRSRWATEAVAVLDEVLSSRVVRNSVDCVILLDLLLGVRGVVETAQVLHMGPRSVKRRRKALRDEMRERLR